MRNYLALALALLANSPLHAQIRAITEVYVPAAPPLSAPGVISPAMTMPTLNSPSLPVPGLTALAPIAAPVPVAAPAAVPAQSALSQTGAALSAAAKEGRDQGAVSREAFDAGAKTPTESPTVAGIGDSPRWSHLEKPENHAARFVKIPAHPLKTALQETIETGAVTIPFALAALLLKGLMANPAILIPSMIALWGIGFWAMRDHLAGLRSTVTGGWQASHDQKYRVDTNTGQLRDIRGHKYGSDRYEEWTNGPVGKFATGLIATTAVVAAAAFLLL